MSNIGIVENCFGCGVCSMVCGKKLIKMKISSEGFYVPYIENAENCTNCGLCESVCSYLTPSISVENHPQLSLAAWSRDENVRKESSSGGVCYEFERTLMDEGFKACLVRYNTKQHRAEHYIANTLDELQQGLGSKYIQSYTLDAFSSMGKHEKYLVVGTPCQIDSFRRYAMRMKKDEDYFLIDFFCHGVPSMLMWGKYVKYMKDKVGQIAYVSWRNKQTGWHDSWVMTADGSERCNKINGETNASTHDYFSRRSKGDPFFTMFLNDMCFNKPCYTHCKYKYDQSAADIRVGDLWGNTFALDEKGVSAVVAFTQRGVDLIKKSNLEFTSYPFEIVAEGQQKSRIAYRKGRDEIVEYMKNDHVTIEDVVKLQQKIQKRQLLIKRITHPIVSCRNLIKKIR